MSWGFVSMGVNPKGDIVTLSTCDVCGSLRAMGADGHSVAGIASDTDTHKAALAIAERKGR